MRRPEGATILKEMLPQGEKMSAKTSLTIIILLLSWSCATAEMYQWTEEDGSVTFKDTPPPASRKSTKVKVYSDGDFDPAPPVPPPSSSRKGRQSATSAAQPARPAKERFSGTVEIYVTEWCGYCKQALEYMTSNGIPFTAYDIEKDSAARQRHRELGGRGVPLIIIGPNKMSGFSAGNLEYYLNNSK
jgi:glutaredoxin-like YruB-family protein